MTRLFPKVRTCVSGVRVTAVARTVASTFVAACLLVGCHADDATSSTDYAQCAGQPGCQTATGAVAPEVTQSLDDASSRVVPTLTPAARTTLAAPLARLQSALIARDIGAGRVALSATLNAIGQAENSCAECRPDLSALRLALAPAARSLGMPVSAIEPPSP